MHLEKGDGREMQAESIYETKLVISFSHPIADRLKLSVLVMAVSYYIACV